MYVHEVRGDDIGSFSKIVRQFVMDEGNYPYVCARVRAKKSLLYNRETIQKFLHMTPVQIARAIGEGEYKGEILALGIRLSGATLVERATRDNLAKTYLQVLGFCEGHLRDMVSKFLARWDVWNVQTILKGKSYGASNREIHSALVPAGSFDVRFLSTLVEKETMADVIEALDGTDYYVPICSVREECEREGSLAALEDALVHTYYRRLLETVIPDTEPNALFVRFIRMEIDMLNLRTFLRLKIGGGQVREGTFLAGGLELTIEELKDAIRLEWNAMMERLRRYGLYPEISSELRTAREEGLNALLRVLERHIMREATRRANVFPLSILPVLDYLLAKKREIDNIRIIARGKEDGLADETIRLLVL